MTYRRDSDIPRPYGWIEPKDEPRTTPWWVGPDTKWRRFDMEAFKASLPSKPEAFKAIARKPKGVAWIVSNCGTRSAREDYVKRLREHVDVEVMGGCGAMRCDKHHRDRDDNCTAAVERDYKFYLSFENSVCDDYATEKFFRRMQHDVLPVVLGGADYGRVSPPHSHLNALDYPDPADLAAEIRRLNDDDEEYLSYFWWKDHYRSVDRRTSLSMCELCKKLHDDDNGGRKEKVYDDLAAWWVDGGHCAKRESLPWAKEKPSFVGAAANRMAKWVMGKPTL